MCKPVEIYNIIRILKYDRGIMFLTIDYEWLTVISMYNDIISIRLIHTKQINKIIIYNWCLLPIDTWHYQVSQ